MLVGALTRLSLGAPVLIYLTFLNLVVPIHRIPFPDEQSCVLLSAFKLTLG